jgi:hypothetical protein
MSVLLQCEAVIPWHIACDSVYANIMFWDTVHYTSQRPLAVSFNHKKKEEILPHKNELDSCASEPAFPFFKYNWLYLLSF